MPTPSIFRRTALLSLAAAALCVWQIAAFHSVRYDDPFVTYRYAQNLVEGHGMVFNPGAGPRLLGATSPGHILLSALVYAIFGTALTPSIMAAIGCIAWSAQALAVYALLGNVLGPFGAAVVALLVDIGAAESFKWVSFETNLASDFALFTLVALQRQRHALVGLCLAFGTLFRPDVLLLAALVFASYLLRRSRAALARALAAFVPWVAGWSIFASLYFGSALPHSAVEKFQRTPLAAYLEHAFRHVGGSVVPLEQNLYLAVCAWLLTILGAVVLSRRDPALLLLSLYTLLHLAAYCWLRPFVEHQWHLYPAVLGSAVLAAGGLAWLSRSASKPPVRSASTLLLGCLTLGVCVRSVRAARELPDDYWTGARDTVYQRIAKYLGDNLHGEDEFASIEVGTLAYYANRKAYDLGGIVTDLKIDPMATHPVRLLILDARYLYTAPPWPPVYSQSEREFRAFVFPMPVNAAVEEARTRPSPALSR